MARVALPCLMEPKEIFEEYWPSILGPIAVIVVAIIVWPDNEDPPIEPTPAGVVASTGREGGIQDTAEATPPKEEKAAAPASKGKSQSSGSKEPRYQIIETLEAFPIDGPKRQAPKRYTMEDPEMKQAVREVQVTIYGGKDCEECEAARAFLGGSGIVVDAKNVDSDSAAKEKARRLSGGYSTPVIVVDGKVLRGFSEAATESALTAAVKKRIEAQPR